MAIKTLLNGFKEKSDMMQFEILNHNSVFCKGNKFKKKKMDIGDQLEGFETWASSANHRSN